MFIFLLRLFFTLKKIIFPASPFSYILSFFWTYLKQNILIFSLLDDAYLLLWKMRLSPARPTPAVAAARTSTSPYLARIFFYWTFRAEEQITLSQVQLLFWTIRVATALALDGTLVNAYQCTLVNVASYSILNVLLSHIPFSIYLLLSSFRLWTSLNLFTLIKYSIPLLMRTLTQASVLAPNFIGSLQNWLEITRLWVSVFQF